MNTIRKTIVMSVMMMTVLSMSVFVVAPAKAAASAGDLIKMDGLSSVYYLGADNKRYVFPNESSYFSWYSDFSSVKTIPQSELESYSLGANVTIRPGTKLVKITTDPKVYAVTSNGNLHWLPSETIAKGLFGDNWAKRVVDVADAFFTNYKISTTNVAENVYPEGSLIKLPSAPEVYYVNADNTVRKVTSEAAFLANRFNWDNIITTATTYTLPAAGMDITGAVATLTDTSSGAGGTPGAGTGMTMALASDTPAGATVPSNATGVVFTKVNVTAANDGPVTLNTLIVKRTGIGATTEISKVYLYDGTTRLTSGKTVNASSNQSEFTNIGWTVPAGTTKVLTIVGDIANNSNGNHAFGIEAATAVGTNGASVSGSFPIRGNIMALSTQSTGKVDVDSSGSDYTRKVGEKAVEVGTFTVYVNSTEDAKVKQITLYQTGRDVLSNFALYRGSDKVADGTKSGSYITFVLTSPFAIAKGESANFTVKADVSGRSDDTETLNVRYNTDVQVVGNTYGYNLGIDESLGTAAQSYIEEAGTTDVSNTTNVDAGQLTMAVNGPSTGDVSKNSNDVALINFSLTAAAAMDVSLLKVTLSDSSSLLNVATDLDDLEIKCGGSSVALSSTVASTTSFTDNWTIPAGTTECQLIVDITNTASGNEKIKATILDLTSTSNATIKDANGDTVSDIVPSGNIAGNEMNITSASLTINVASTPASGQTYVKGQADAGIVGLTFTAGQAADVKVTSVKLTALRSEGDYDFSDESDADETSGAANAMSSIKIYDGATLLGTKSLTVGSADITVTFDGLSWTIPAGQQKTLTAKATIGSVVAATSSIALKIGSASDVASEYGTGGTDLGETLTDGNGTPSVIQFVTTGGTLAMALDADTPTSKLVVAGASAVAFTKAKFTATQEAYIIDRLEIKNPENGVAGDDEFADVILEYKDKDGNTKTDTKGLSGGVANFTGLTIYVPKDGNAVVTAKANLNTYTGGADNAAAIALDFDPNTEFRAVGQASGETKANAGSTEAQGNNMTVYKSVPTFAVNSSTPSGTLNPSADTLVGIFNVSADAGDDITFENADSNLIKFAVAGSGTTSSVTWTLKDGDGNTLATTSAALTGSTVTFEFAARSFTVPAGTTKQLKVYTNTSNLSTAGNSIQIYLDDDADTNVNWGINGTGSYGHGTILFRGDLYGGSLVRP